MKHENCAGALASIKTSLKPLTASSATPSQHMGRGKKVPVPFSAPTSVLAASGAFVDYCYFILFHLSVCLIVSPAIAVSNVNAWSPTRTLGGHFVRKKSVSIRLSTALGAHGLAGDSKPRGPRMHFRARDCASAGPRLRPIGKKQS